MRTTLPERDGVGASAVTVPAGAPLRLLDFLAARFPRIAHDEWRSRLRRGLVFDGYGQALGEDAASQAGNTVYYYRELPPEPQVPFAEEILFQDEHLLVADKPHFLPVMPGGRYLQQTLLVRLRKRLGLDHIVPLHRIDRGTAGLVLLSVNPATRAAYQVLFAQRAMHKVYEALAPALEESDFPLVRRSRLVKGEPFFRMREVPGAVNSETHIEIAQRRGALNLYRLRPITGKQHQLRVHLAALGAGIVNDPWYPELRPEAPDDYARPLKLLARELAFLDPLSGLRRWYRSARTLDA